MKRGWWALGVVGVLAACESTSVPKTDIPDSPDPTVDAGADGAPLPPPPVAPKVAPIGKQTIVIGRQVTFRVTLERGSLAGPLEMTITGLPAGVTAKSEPIAAEASAADVTLSATENVAFGTSKASVQVGKDAALSAPFDLEVRGVPGTLDRTFGTEGLVADVSPISRVTVLGDGTVFEQGELGRIRKRKADGTIDASFGSQGDVQLSELNAVGIAQNIPSAPVVDSAGSVFAAYVHLGGGASTRSAFVAKLTPRGTRDASFGTNGVAPLPDLADGTSYRITRLLLLSDGSVVVVANIGVGATAACTLFRISPTGTLDTTWGPTSDGKATFTNGVSGRQDVLGATTSAGGFFFATIAADRIWQARWNSRGVPDPAFGGGPGFTVTTGNFGDAFTEMNPMLAKRADGALDVGFVEGGFAKTTRFSAGGLVDTGYGTRTHPIPATRGSSGGAVVDNQGRTLFGFSDGVERTKVDIWRFTPTGAIDTTLNGNGRLSLQFPANVVGVGIGIRTIHELPDGRMVVAATGAGNVIVRFWP